MVDHTEGPWFADLHHTRRGGGRTYGFIRARNHLVPVAAVPLDVDGYGRSEGEANARILGASLASHLACKAFVSACGGNPPDWLREEYSAAENAIAAAEGRANG